MIFCNVVYAYAYVYNAVPFRGPQLPRYNEARLYVRNVRRSLVAVEGRFRG